MSVNRTRQLNDPRSGGSETPNETVRFSDSPGSDSSAPATGIRDLWGAIRFLFPPGYPDEWRPTSSSVGTAWIVPLGLIVGLLWASLFRVTWRVFGETGSLRVIPSLAVVLLECLFTGPFLAMGLARTVHLLVGAAPRREALDRSTPLSPVGTLVLVLAVLSQYVLIASIQPVSPWWPAPNDWRSIFNFMYPQPIYRPLLLAPLWGRWGILLAATVGRPAPNADHCTVAICRAMRPGRLILSLIAPIVLTAIYCSRSQNFLIGVIAGMVVFGFTYLVAVVLARRGGGQTRQSLFACGQIAQLALLTSYRAFWPLIHQ